MGLVDLEYLSPLNPDRRTVRDNHVGATPTTIVLPKGVERLMLVPDRMRKCALFVYCQVNGNKLPLGTAFWVGYPVPRFPDNHLGVVVTANHVIARAKALGDDGKVYLRVNLIDGGSDWHKSAADAWLQTDTNVDVAIYGWNHDVDGPGVEYRGWSLRDNVATDDVIEREGIGIGDEVFMVGLFRNHLGKARNEPILRVGNIAAIPVDPIQSKFGPMKAILIEARSIGGLSGSPVFVHMGYARWRNGQLAQAGTDSPFLFLGVMQGHWEVTQEEAAGDTTDAVTPERIHTGIGVVVPAEVVMKNVLDPVIGEIALARAKQLDDENTPKPDDVLVEDTITPTKDLLGKLLQVPKDETED